MYYITKEGNLYLYSDNKKALEDYNMPVKELLNVTAADFDRDKYIVNNDILVPAPDYEAEQAEKECIAHIKEIKTQLDELDKKRIRAMCEPSEYAKGISWLEYYNQQARELRTELQELEGADIDSNSKK